MNVGIMKRLELSLADGDQPIDDSLTDNTASGSSSTSSEKRPLASAGTTANATTVATAGGLIPLFRDAYVDIAFVTHEEAPGVPDECSLSSRLNSSRARCAPLS